MANTCDILQSVATAAKPTVQRQKTSISVPEMRRLLGLGKTDSYQLVKKGYFKTIIAGGQMRIMLDSFKDWYAGQFHYKKVTGEAPGSKWTATTMSVQEAADLIGITTSSFYDLLKKKPFETIHIDKEIHKILRNAFNQAVKWELMSRNPVINKKIMYGFFNGF